MVPDGWERKTLAEIAYINPQKPDRPKDGYVSFIPMDAVSENAKLLRLEDRKYNIVEKGFTSFKDNDVLIAKITPCFENGKGALVSGLKNGVGFGSTEFHILRARSGSCSEFLYYLTTDKEFRIRGEMNMQGSAGQKRVTTGYLKIFKVLVPPFPEQKKIAEILSAWDKAISTTERLLANGKRQKEALMRQLLIGIKRFGKLADSFDYKKTRYGKIPADWDYPRIRDICSQVSEKNSKKADYPVISCSKHEGFVDSLKYFKKKVYSEDTSGYRVIPRGCFGFPSNHIEEGSIGLQNIYDVGIVSPIYVVFRANPEKVNNEYLFALLKSEHYRQIFSAATNGSVDRRGSLRWKEFGSIHVPLPPLEEQNEIVSALSVADREIEALQKKLNCLQQEKKALMPQLLTGKRRVKI